VRRRGAEIFERCLIRRVWPVARILKNHRYQVFQAQLIWRVCRCLVVKARLKQFFILKEAFNATRQKQYERAQESDDGRGDVGGDSRRVARWKPERLEAEHDQELASR
jgi:hypothetical protein